jgi:hypothetical protein
MLSTKYNTAVQTETYPIILGMACPMIILKLSKFQTPIFILHFLMSNGCHNHTHTHTHTHTQNFFGCIDIDTWSLSQLLVPAVKTWPRICHTLEFSNKIMWWYWWKETHFFILHSAQWTHTLNNCNFFLLFCRLALMELIPRFGKQWELNTCHGIITRWE